MKKIMILTSTLGLLFLLSGCQSAGPSVTDAETIVLKDFNKLNIESSSADITIIQEDREDIKVVLETYENGPRLEVHEGDNLIIEATKEEPFFFSLNYSPELKVYIPNDYEQALDVHNSSGDGLFKDLKVSELMIDFSSGDIQGYDISTSTAYVESSSGDVTFDGFTCDTFESNLSSGDLHLTDFVGEIDGDSSSGDTRILLKELSAPIKYHASSGDIILEFKDQVNNGEFKLDCSSGDVVMGVDLDDYDENKEDSIKGTVGNGDYLVDLSTSSGDIFVKD